MHGERTEEIVNPDLPIIDPHHHLWEQAEAGGAANDPFSRRYLLPEILDDMGAGHNVTATVYVECHSMYRQHGPEHLKPLGEVEFANGVGAMSDSGRYGQTKLCAGIVGHADLMLGERVEEVLERLAGAASDRLRGIRHMTSWDPDGILTRPRANPPWQGMLLDPTLRVGFSRLASHNLSFDSWQFHFQLPDVLDLARAFPETRIIIDHCGGPVGFGPYEEKRAEVFDLWRSNLKALSSCPNVAIKLGGLGMWIAGFPFSAAEQTPSETIAAAWRPYIETCIELFGPDRSMFESNFPVDSSACSYPVLWNVFKRIAAQYTPSEQADLFAGTAARVYRLN